jgi:hypothetical protein
LQKAAAADVEEDTLAMLDDLDDRDDDEMDEDEDDAGEGLDDGDDDDWEDVDVAAAGDEAAAPGTAAGQVLYVEGRPVPANQITDEHVVGIQSQGCRKRRNVERTTPTC